MNLEFIPLEGRKAPRTGQTRGERHQTEKWSLVNWKNPETIFVAEIAGTFPCRKSESWKRPPYKWSSRAACMRSCLLLSHLWLLATLWTVARQAPRCVGLFSARILEWVATSSSRGSSRPRDQPLISCISCAAGGFLTTEPQGKPALLAHPTWKNRSQNPKVPPK